MRKIALALGVLAVGMTGCDNTLDLTAPWKDIPVVYGVLSPVDTAQYVRIEKAFLDPQRSALEIARIPDSLYYPALQADLVRVSTSQRIPLTEVDGTDEGYPRQDGVFATVPNILYKTTQAVAAGERYRLEIVRSDQLPLVTAETTIVGRPTIQSPAPGASLRFENPNFFRVLWIEAPSAAFYDLILFFHYSEFDISDPTEVTDKTAAWKMSGITTATEFQVMGGEFYEFLKAAIPEESTKRRMFQGIDLQVRAGGEELYEFQRVQLANAGITSAGGDVPQYTNLSEGVGIFSSSNRHALLNFQLHPATRDSLINGSVTENLNFQ